MRLVKDKYVQKFVLREKLVGEKLKQILKGNHFHA